MRYKVFVDTNILLSGIFFDGNESRILVEIDLSEGFSCKDQIIPTKIIDNSDVKLMKNRLEKARSV
ncbi:MAG: hypothetical protein AB1480_14450 [Nitrospirota bacterium]